MRKWLVPLMLVLAMLCAGTPGWAEGTEITLQIDTEKLPMYDAADPAVAGLLSPDAAAEVAALPVLTVQVKKSLDLRATVMPKTVKNRKVVLYSDNSAVAKTNGTRVTGVSAGETVVTVASAQDPEVKTQFRVLVLQPVTHINVTAESKTVAVGGQVALTAAITPDNASVPQVVWSSANEQIATVDENGVVTGTGRGTARIIAAATDGSKIKANFSLNVTQPAESITLDKPEATVSVTRNIVLRATVLPKNTSDKVVVWSSSDESIAKVNQQGRVTGVALGDCEIICASKATGNVEARATVHVQQPVKAIRFGDAPAVYVGESGRLTWSVEPENASNPALAFSTGNKKIVTVSEDGTITGVKAGEAWVNALSTDGSNRRARVKVKVLQHVTGVHMKRKTAYVSRGETSVTGAELEPKDASNKNMTWESLNPSVATVAGVAKQGNRVKITGVGAGETTVIGTTEDGGYQTSITVRIGDWDHALKLTAAEVRGADAYLTVRNDSDLRITSVTAEVSVFDVNGNPVKANSKDGSNTFKMVYQKTLNPGSSTKESNWKAVNFTLPDSPTVATYVVTVTQYQIDNDWVKTIRKKYQPSKNCPVHI